MQTASSMLAKFNLSRSARGMHQENSSGQQVKTIKRWSRHDVVTVDSSASAHRGPRHLEQLI